MRTLSKYGSHPLVLFIGIWLVVNGLQAGFTELDPDEAYYWVYSKQLAWGYFDHPAVIALLIKIGYALFPIEFGVRFFPLLLQCGTIYFLWLLTDKPVEKNKFLTFALLVAAMPMLTVYSFIATPDSPLLFFASVYLYLYRRFLKEPTWLITILLGICMAALLHSKYHGILLIFFCLASNWRLLLNYKFYVAGILGLLLFFPHLYWQYTNDFPSIRYHLSGRDDVYQLKYTGNYLLNQLLIFSPFLFPFIIQALIQYRAKDIFEKCWKVVMLGIWLLFLVLTYKGHAEPQWTAIISLPAVLLVYQYLREYPQKVRWVRRMAWLTIGVLLLGRIFLVLPLKNIDSDFHKRTWVQELVQKAGGLPIVFVDSYRDPSKFAFYSGQPPYGYTDVKYRKNQYDLWDWAKVLHQQKVFLVGSGEWECGACLPLQLTNRGFKKYQVIEQFQVSQNIWIDYIEQPLIDLQQTAINLKLAIDNPYSFEIAFGSGDFPLQLVAIFMNEEGMQKKQLLPVNNLQLAATQKNNISTQLLKPNALEGSFQLFIGIQMGDLPPAIHSTPIEVNFKD